MKKFRTIILCGAALLASCTVSSATTASPPEEPRPAMWKLADEDTTIYLFGTIHLLPQGMAWRTPMVEQALAHSDTLAIEVLMPENPAESAQAMMALGTSPGLPPLAERVPADKKEVLAELIQSSGVPPQFFDRMETWAAALTLAGISLVKLGFDPNLGVETRLKADYADTGKPVIGLETVEQQFGFFDTLPEEAQRTLLVGTLDDPAKVKAQFEAMLRAWVAGDIEKIADTFNSDVSLSPELREALLTRRNEAWAEWLRDRLEEPGTVFLAVGAGHLAGPDSVQARLKADGLKVDRLQ